MYKTSKCCFSYHQNQPFSFCAVINTINNKWHFFPYTLVELIVTIIDVEERFKLKWIQNQRGKDHSDEDWMNTKIKQQAWMFYSRSSSQEASQQEVHVILKFLHSLYQVLLLPLEIFHSSELCKAPFSANNSAQFLQNIRSILA